jgi:hypothetical protein
MSIVFRKNDQVFNFLYSEIEKATTSIKVAVAWFTDPELLKLLLNQRDEKRIAVEVILYNDALNSKLKKLKNLKDDLRFSDINPKAIMHHKFVVIDDRKVITGSYNWTIKARRYNRENVLLIDEPSIIREYLSEFNNLILNSKTQSNTPGLRSVPMAETIEDENLLELEQEFNQEILDKIKVTDDLGIPVNIPLAYELVRKHTPVIAAAKLASAENGELIQGGLEKLHEANKLELSFEQSIIKKKYEKLFYKSTIEFARKKLEKLHYFTNPIYSDLVGE